MLAEFGNRDCPPRSVPVDRGLKAAPGRCGRRRCGRASEEPAFELGKQLLKLKLFLPLFGDLPKDPARLVASVVMPGQRGVVCGDVLCDLSPLLLKQCSKVLGLTFLGGRNERKHVGGRAGRLEFYNVRRRHSSAGLQPPADYEKTAADHPVAA